VCDYRADESKFRWRSNRLQKTSVILSIMEECESLGEVDDEEPPQTAQTVDGHCPFNDPTTATASHCE